jgi:hypothetical protein
MKVFLSLILMLAGLSAHSQADDVTQGIDRQRRHIDSLVNNKADGLVLVEALPLGIIDSTGAAERTVTVKGYFYNNRLVKAIMAGNGIGISQGMSPQPYPGWFTEYFYFWDGGLIMADIQSTNPPEMQISCGGAFGQHRSYFKGNQRYKPKTFGRPARECGWGPKYIITKPAIEKIVAQAEQHLKSK